MSEFPNNHEPGIPPYDAEPQALPALPYEQERRVEPDFGQNVSRLEQIARQGIETPRGVEHYEFRAGIEVEYVLMPPADVREELTKPTTEEGRQYILSQILNPEAIDLEPDRSGIEAFREQARQLVSNLKPSDEVEAARRDMWLDEVDTLGLPELINFQLYAEFANPTLDTRSVSPDATLAELDAFAEKHGWIEFRFGKGKLQAGYYDNEGVSELRTAPATPAETLMRRKMILNRLRSLATQYGVVVNTSSVMEHVNLSAYTPDESTGEWVSPIGQAEDKQAVTGDMVGGIAAAFEDGHHLHADGMKWDYKFDAVHGGEELRFGATRKTVRILDGRIELRSQFNSADQAVNWLMAGTLYGLQTGADGLEQAGYEVPKPTQIFKVTRGEGFDKNRHLPVQRALENSVYEDDRFQLDPGHNMIRFNSISKALVGEAAAEGGNDFLNEIIIGAVRLDAEGVPSVTANDILQRFSELDDKKRSYLDKFDVPNTAAQLEPTINEALRTVRLQPTTVIQGAVHYKVNGRQAAYERLQQSPVAALAVPGSVEEYTAWLQGSTS